uniref:Parathyroid hormone n=1 Tax=Cyprinodon variegatus TaxID=28743 RepID=A0A3Q2GNI5_CYPVA
MLTNFVYCISYLLQLFTIRKSTKRLLKTFKCHLFSIFFFFYRKRSISEVQFMHNVQEHKQVGERQDWLQEKLKKIVLASPKPKYAKLGNLKSLPPESLQFYIIYTHIQLHNIIKIKNKNKKR